MSEKTPAGGNILVYAKVRHPESRAALWHLLENLPGERVAGCLYEVSAEDWDDGLWEEEIGRMQELIDPDSDTLIYWQVIDQKMVRTCVAGRFA